MTDQEREALVERVCQEGTPGWAALGPFSQEVLRRQVAHYLAVAERVVREDEREAITNLPVFPPPSADATDALIAYRDAIARLNGATDGEIDAAIRQEPPHE